MRFCLRSFALRVCFFLNAPTSSNHRNAVTFIKILFVHKRCEETYWDTRQGCDRGTLRRSSRLRDISLARFLTSFDDGVVFFFRVRSFATFFYMFVFILTMICEPYESSFESKTFINFVISSLCAPLSSSRTIYPQDQTYGYCV